MIYNSLVIIILGFHPLTPIIASLPFDHVAVDLFGPFPASNNGFTFVLLLACIATRFVLLCPLLNKKSHNKARRLSNRLLLLDSLVMWRDVDKTKKSSPKFAGPYTIGSICKNGSYTLSDVTGERYPSKVTAKHLKFNQNSCQYFGQSGDWRHSWSPWVIQGSISFHGRIVTALSTAGFLSVDFDTIDMIDSNRSQARQICYWCSCYGRRYGS